MSIASASAYKRTPGKEVGELVMRERDIVRSIIDFSFIVKAQLKSPETLLLRSLLNILIIEAEDVLEGPRDRREEKPDRDSAS